MEDLNSSICKMIFIECLKEEVRETEETIKNLNKKIDNERDLCKHDLVLYYGSSIHNGKMYQCLGCETYYESSFMEDNPFENSKIIDAHEDNIVCPNERVFNKMRLKIINAFNDNPNITIDEFCDSLNKGKVKKIGIIK